MAWNEPGGSGDKDPWGNRDRKDQGPPDLDEIVKKIQSKLSGLFGGRGLRPVGSNGDGSSSGGGGNIIVSLVIIVAVIVWLFSGIYIVEPAERGVVTQFGKYVSSTGPGPHWHIPYPIEKIEIVDVDQSRNVEIGYRSNDTRDINVIPQESLMLTEDENIVDILFAVQYRIKDAKDYLFSVRNPDQTLREATESAVRSAIGKSNMDFVLTQGQSEIAERIERVMQQILDLYKTGLIVTSVNLQSAQPPQEVKGAFDDAIKAREDKQRLINDAEAYANDIIPKARGNAARQLEAANGYKERVIAQAEGESSRFTQLFTEYEKAPEVTRQRLYIESVESVMENTTKVLVDTKGSNNLLYLPLDKLIPSNANSVMTPNIRQLPPETITDRQSDSRPHNRDASRSRERR